MGLKSKIILRFKKTTEELICTVFGMSFAAGKCSLLHFQSKMQIQLYNNKCIADSVVQHQ